MSIIVTHDTAVRAIRCLRRRRTFYDVRPVTGSAGERALDEATAGKRSVDLDVLAISGLWNEDAGEPLHLLVGKRGRTRTAEEVVTVHSCTRCLPAGSLLKVGHGLYCASPSLCLLQHAASHTFEETLALACEFCGEYSFSDLEENDSGDKDGFLKSKPVLTIRELERFSELAAGMPGAKMLREVVRHAFPDCRSPMETLTGALFRLPHFRGGFGIKDLDVNTRVYYTEKARTIAQMPYAVCDFFSKDAKTDLEYNGYYHADQEARRHDERRNSALASMGIQVLQINDEQIRNLEALESMARSMYRRAGRYLRIERKDFKSRQLALERNMREALRLPR